MGKFADADFHRRRRSSGFTLLELLVAITLLSLIALLMLGGLRLGARAWERGETAAEGREAVWAAQSLLQSLLSRMYPQWHVDAPGQGRVLIDGDAQHLTFMAPPPAQFGPGANLDFNLMLSKGDLILEWTSEQGVDRSSSVLLRDVKVIDLSYYGSDTIGGAPAWSNSWHNRSSPPKLIRVSVAFASNDRRFWPEFVVHPEIAVDVSCVFDAITRGCRGRPE